jgi:hypothetical protein
MKIKANKLLNGLSTKQEKVFTEIDLPFIPFVGLRLMILGNWEEITTVWWTGDEFVVSLREDDSAYWGGKYTGEDYLPETVHKFLSTGWEQ